MTKKRLTIIGGGATGTCVLLHAIQKFNHDVDIVLIDPHQKIGLGKAYNTSDEENLLNVAAENMGIYCSEPNHFAKWLKTQTLAEKVSEHWPFVPRKLFGLYLQSELSKTSFTHEQDLVTEVSSQSNQYQLKLKSGKRLTTDFLVIATGYKEENNIFSHLIDKAKSTKLHYPAEVEVKSFNGKENVLIVGTGLTAIDVWKRLRKFNLTMTFVSRHGLFPLTHQHGERIEKFPALAGMTPFQIFDVVVSLRKIYSYQQIADEIRKQNRAIWTCWSAGEKKQFIRWMKPFWEVMRHRLPGSVSQILEQDLASGKAKLLAGKIIQLTPEEGSISAQLRIKKKGIHEERFDHVILATGTSINQDLFKDRKVPGIKFSSNGFGYINVSAPNIWFAGPSSKATYWEITAIPDIRVQAAEIVSALSERLHQDSYSKFLEHPSATGESYFEHMKQAFAFSGTLLKKALHAFVHGIFPFYYTDKTSNDIRDFSKKLSKRRQKDFKS